MAAINLDIGGNTRRLDRDIQKTVNRVYTINLKTKGDQPLGRITGQVNEFNKSLDASNARVIAFGASAGIIFGVQRAFTALVGATIEVQKSLQDINVILNVSAQNLQKFGGELFSIAKNTGQSFQEVAKAATEFSRQGLGVEETLKRTSEALILSRLSGLDAAKSVEALTAAVNSYASQAVTATEVVNKFANVDAAFAVSSADLAEALQRVGSSAAQSGVSLNELIAIVTSAQQTTARGGAVIGNSFKTIFTRLQRGKVVDLLESLGISSTDSSGQVKSTIQLLQDLGKVYDTLGSQQQAYVAEQVGGVFQINILKAALADLGKEYSIYSSALNVAAGSTDQAIRRNEELNKTYAAQINALQENARQLAATAGERLLGPSIDRLVGGTNTLLNGFNESDGQGIGAVLGKGILDGIGQFISGPGLALIGGVLLKLFRDLGKFATGSVQQLLGLNTAATQQRDLQASIGQILAKNPQLLELALKGEQGLNTAANSLLASLQKQTVELQKQATVAQQISRAFVAQAGVRVAGGVPVAPTGRAGKAAGYIPNFAQGDFAREELLAASLGAKNPTAQLSKGTIDGKKFIKNNREVEITGFGSNGDSAVIPNYGRGFIPNFAKTKTEKFTDFGGKYAYLVPFGVPDGTLPTGKIGKYKVGGIPIKSPKKVDIEKDADKDSLNLYKNIEKVVVDEAFKYTNTIRPLNKGVSIDSIKSRFETTAGAAGALKGAAGAAFEVGIISALDYQSASRRGEVAGNFDVRGGANLAQIQDLFDLRPSVGLADFKVNADPGNIKKFYDKVSKEEKAGVFDDREQTRNINRDAEVEVSRELAKDENLKKWVISGNKISARAPDFVKKMVEERKNLIRPRYNLASFPKGPIRAAGYIPNFAAIQDAVSRERAAGIPSSQIYLAQEKALTSANPMGLGVFNKRDEPTAGKRREQMKRKGFARGFVPNFAIEDPDTQAADFGSSIGAVVAQLGFLAFSLQGSREQYKQSLKELTSSNVAAAKNNLRAARDFGASEQVRRQLSQNVKTAQAGSAGQKFAAASGAGGFALSIGAPIIAETIKNSIGQETASNRKAGAAVGAAGEIASFAGAGAMFGPWGAAIGAATGALLTVPGLIDEMTATAPEFAKAAQKASQDLTKFNDAGQRVLTSSSELSKLLKEGGSQNLIQKAQETYNKSLLELSSVDRQRLSSAAKVGKLEDEYSKILAEKIAKEQSAKSETSLAGVRDEIAADTVKTKLFSGAGAFTIGNAIFPGLGSTVAPFVSGLASEQKDYLSLGTEEGRKRRAGIAENFTTELRGNKSPEEFLKSLRDIKIPKEVTNKTQFDSFINGLKELPTGFKNTLKEIAATDPEEAFKLLRAQIVYLRKDTADFIKDSSALQDAEKERQAILKQEQAAIDATVSSIQKNIAVQNLWKSAIENINESIISFSRDLEITQNLTQPKQVLGGLIGEDKTPTRRLAAQEGIARINETTRSGLATAGIDFKETVRGATQAPFQENIDKIVKKLGEQGGALQGEPEEIIKQSDQFRSEAKAEENKLLQATQKIEGYMGQFISGQMSTNQLLEASRSELSGIGIEASRGSQASDAIEKAVAELEAKSLQEQIKAFQQRAKLASETKQAILQSRIDQAIGTFGGFEGFTNRPQEEQNYIQKIGSDLGKIQNIRGSSAFRYNNKDSIEEQEKQAPELGRAFANVYKELIAQSGGGFRDFLQQTIDQGMQQTGTESRGARAGAGLAGGFDDIVRGRQQDLEQQLKLAEDQIKVTTDPALKRDLQGFVDSIRKMPGGTKGIAQLQTQKELGVARQGDFAKLYGKYENEALNRLKDISPELAASLESAISLSDDPLVAESQLQTSLQSEMVGYMGPIQQAILQIANSGGRNVTGAIGEMSQIEAYKPKLTEEQQKKADELRTAQEKIATKVEDAQKQKSSPQQNVSPEQLKSDEIARKRRDLGLEYNRANILPDSKPSAQQGRSPEQIKSDEIARKRRDLGLEYNRANILPDSKPSAQQNASSEQSFTQQEAAFATNTTAITALTGGIQTLNATLSSFQELNKTADVASVGAGAQAVTQPNVTTTTNAPVNVIVNAQNQTDIAKAIGEAVQNAIPNIIEKVRLSLGEKVPPTTSQLPNINIK